MDQKDASVSKKRLPAQSPAGSPPLDGISGSRSFCLSDTHRTLPWALSRARAGRVCFTTCSREWQNSTSCTLVKTILCVYFVFPLKDVVGDRKFQITCSGRRNHLPCPRPASWCDPHLYHINIVHAKTLKALLNTPWQGFNLKAASCVVFKLCTRCLRSDAVTDLIF